MDPTDSSKNTTGSSGQTQDIPMLNDEDIAKILQPTELFPDEVITPSTKPSATPSNVEIDDIINNRAKSNETLNNNSFYNKSLAQKDDHITEIVRRNDAPIGVFERYPQNNLLSSNIIKHDDNPTLQHNSSVSSQLSKQSNTSSISQLGEDNNTAAQINARRIHMQKNRPAFVNKIWSMINDPANQTLIKWMPDGESFYVENREQFVHDVLPKYFKHSNFASFVRQLNMYGWHKVQDVKSGSIQNSSDDKWQFENPNFVRDREDLLVNIVRQKSSSHTHSNNNSNQQQNTFNIANAQNINALPNRQRPMLHLMNEPSTYSGMNVPRDVTTVLHELETIKYNQMAISKDLQRINKDNELLWKENMMARDRYRTQQQALEKIFRFLSSMVPHMDQKMLMDGIMNFGEKGSTNDAGNLGGSIDPLSNRNSTDGNSNIHYANNIPGSNESFEDIIHNSGIDDTTKSKSSASNDRFSSSARFESPMTQIFNDLANDIHTQSFTDNPLSGGTKPNGKYEYVGRPSTKTRLLLKNRSNSGSPVDINGTTTNDANGTTKISELPYDEEESLNGSPLVKDALQKDGANQTSTADANQENDEFLNHLQSNIEEQDIRIQHLEDMVKGLSPEKSKSTGNKDDENTFNLQDYLANDALNGLEDRDQVPEPMGSHLLDAQSGLTPLFYDDNSLLHAGDQPDRKRTLDAMDEDMVPLVKVEDPNGISHTNSLQDINAARAKIEELSPEPNAKQAKFK